MLRIPLALVLTFTCSFLFATGQQPDLLRIGNKIYFLVNLPPLNDPASKKVPIFMGPFNSGCWRRYVATWEIRDGKFWIVDVKGTIVAHPPTISELEADYNRRLKGNPPFNPSEDHTLQIFHMCLLNPKRQAPATLELLYPGLVQDGRVFASWYTGVLHIREKGRYVNTTTGYRFIFEQEHFFSVKCGVIISERHEDNRDKILPQDEHSNE